MTFRHAKCGDIKHVVEIANSFALSRLSSSEQESLGFLVSGFGEDDYKKLIHTAEYFLVLNDCEKIRAFIVAYNHTSIKPDTPVDVAILNYCSDPFVVIKQICVERSHARKGYATALLKRVSHLSGNLPLYSAIVLSPKNHSSVAFHEGLGFHKVFEILPIDGIRRGIWEMDTSLK